MATVATDEDGIGRGDCDTIAVYLAEVADVDDDAGSAEAASVLMDDGLALRADLEGFDMKVGEVEAGLYRDAARAEADVP